MSRIGFPELIVIFLIILVLFGAQKLPEIGAALGKALREFKKATQGAEEEFKQSLHDKDSDKKS